MNVNSSCPAVASTMASMCGRGNGSLGHALLRSVKSMHTLHLPFFFRTATTFANHSGYFTSRIFPVLRRLSTSSLITLFRSGANLRHFRLTGLMVGSTFSLSEITSGSIPTISSCVHAKRSLFSCKKDITFCLIGKSRDEPIYTTRSDFS